MTTADLHRIINLNLPVPPPLVIYTDAEGSGRLGYAVYHNGKLLRWGTSKVTDKVKDHLLPRLTQINAFEVIAAIWAIMNCIDLLANHAVQVYIDNTTAQAILAKETLSAPDLGTITGHFWQWAAGHRLRLEWFRVASKASPADAPSRSGRPPLCPPGMAPSHGNIETIYTLLQ